MCRNNLGREVRWEEEEMVNISRPISRPAFPWVRSKIRSWRQKERRFPASIRDCPSRKLTKSAYISSLVLSVSVLSAGFRSAHKMPFNVRSSSRWLALNASEPHVAPAFTVLRCSASSDVQASMCITRMTGVALDLHIASASACSMTNASAASTSYTGFWSVFSTPT